MTRISLIASGTRGDVQPAIALGLALRRAGYAVRVLAGSGFRAWIEGHGLEAAPSRVDMQAVMDSPAGREWVRNGHRQLRQLRLMRAIVAEHAGALIADAVDACEDADLVLSGFTSDAYALAIGERRGIPVASLQLSPALIATRDGRVLQGAPFPDRVSRANAWFGRLVMEPATWRIYGDAVNRYRRSVGLRAQSAGEHVAQRRAMVMLHGVSRHVLPRPADWPPGCHVTGYWFLDEAGGWSPAAELDAFLQAGDPPVVVGFGSMTGGDPAGTAAIVAEAMRSTGRRTILLAGWGGLGAPVAGDDPAMLALPEAPHAWLFPRAAAVVHHGGAGTTAAALRAGVPQVVVPHMADQPYWARRVAALGVAPGAIPRHRLAARTLAAAIDAAASDGAMRVRAAALAAGIAAEDGPSEAVARVRELVAP